MASDSSALLSLLMQHVSTHTHSSWSLRACWQHRRIFWKPLRSWSFSRCARSIAGRFCMSLKWTSSCGWAQQCDRMAYVVFPPGSTKSSSSSGFPPSLMSRTAFTLTRRMDLVCKHNRYRTTHKERFTHRECADADRRMMIAESKQLT